MGLNQDQRHYVLRLSFTHLSQVQQKIQQLKFKITKYV